MSRLLKRRHSWISSPAASRNWAGTLHWRQKTTTSQLSSLQPLSKLWRSQGAYDLVNIWRSPWACGSSSRHLTFIPQKTDAERRFDEDDEYGSGRNNAIVEEEENLEDDFGEGSQDIEVTMDSRQGKSMKAPKAQKQSSVEQGRQLNEEIKAKTIRLVIDGKDHRVVSKHEALAYAKQHNLDLVLVDGRADPPVCKVFDYHKEEYKQDQIQKERKKKRAETARLDDVKELRFSSKTEFKDLTMKVEKAKEFLDRGHRVKFLAVSKGELPPEDNKKEKTDQTELLVEKSPSVREPFSERKRRAEIERKEREAALNRKRRREADIAEMLDQITPLIEDVAYIEQGPKIEGNQGWILCRHIKFAKGKKMASKPQANSETEEPQTHYDVQQERSDIKMQSEAPAKASTSVQSEMNQNKRTGTSETTLRWSEEALRQSQRPLETIVKKESTGSGNRTSETSQEAMISREGPQSSPWIPKNSSIGNQGYKRQSQASQSSPTFPSLALHGQQENQVPHLSPLEDLNAGESPVWGLPSHSQESKPSAAQLEISQGAIQSSQADTGIGQSTQRMTISSHGQGAPFSPLKHFQTSVQSSQFSFQNRESGVPAAAQAQTSQGPLGYSPFRNPLTSPNIQPASTMPSRGRGLPLQKAPGPLSRPSQQSQGSGAPGAQLLSQSQESGASDAQAQASQAPLQGPLGYPPLRSSDVPSRVGPPALRTSPPPDYQGFSPKNQSRSLFSPQSSGSPAIGLPSQNKESGSRSSQAQAIQHPPPEGLLGYPPQLSDIPPRTGQPGPRIPPPPHDQASLSSLSVHNQASGASNVELPSLSQESRASEAQVQASQGPLGGPLGYPPLRSSQVPSRTGQPGGWMSLPSRGRGTPAHNKQGSPDFSSEN